MTFITNNIELIQNDKYLTDSKYYIYNDYS